MRRILAAALACATLWAGAPARAQVTVTTPEGIPGQAAHPLLCPTLGPAYVLCGSPGALPLVPPGGPAYLMPSPAPQAGLPELATASAVSNLLLKLGNGNLYSLTVTIGATSGWLMLFDATIIPNNGATSTSGTTPLKYCYPILSNGTVGGVTLSWNPGPPVPFVNGMVAAFSSTACNSLTASTTAFFYGQVF